MPDRTACSMRRDDGEVSIFKPELLPSQPFKQFCRAWTSSTCQTFFSEPAYECFVEWLVNEELANSFLINTNAAAVALALALALAAPRARVPPLLSLRATLAGGDCGEATPVPIPNTEVKLPGADGTAPKRVWESR